MTDTLTQTDKILSYINSAKAPSEAAYPSTLDQSVVHQATEEIRHWQGYAETPLRSLDQLAEQIGVSKVYYKDESTRFGLGSFKALGGAYAVLVKLQEELSKQLGRTVSFEEIRNGSLAKEASGITVATATDGNHGRSVAWGAQLFGCPCRIYIHAEVSEGRKAAMEAYGATVIRIDGNYDDSVDAAAADAKANPNWHIVSDSSYPGYMDLPRHVMAGYSVLMDEVMDQLSVGEKLTHVLIQGGVGGLAGAVCGYLWNRLGADRPRFVVVEPLLADCLYQSAVHGTPTEVTIEEETIMAGLSCGKVSDLAWEILYPGTDNFLVVGDEQVPAMMRWMADQGVVAGESAVAGLIPLFTAKPGSKLAVDLGLTEESKILLIGTEGDTDPDIYQRIVGKSASEVRGDE